MIKSLARSMLESFLAGRGYRLAAHNLFNWPLRDAEFMEIFQRQARFGWKETSGPTDSTNVHGAEPAAVNEGVAWRLG